MRELYSCRNKNDYYISYEYLRKVTRIDKFAPIVKKLAGRPGFVVDLGCGTGIWSRTLSEIGEFLGVDFIEARIKIAKERNPTLRYRAHDIGKIGTLFKKNSVGMFFSSCALYCLVPGVQKKLFSDIHSSLKDGGRIIFIEPNKSNLFGETSEAKYLFDKKNTEQLLSSLGFRNIEIKNYNFMPRFLLRRRGMLYKLMIPVEKILELLHIPFSGSLMIYAEK
jgi:SAM-dependent methyltransferase